MIADDPRKPMDPSGIRFGTPAITTRKFKEKECARVAELMVVAMQKRGEPDVQKAIREEIREMCAKFPIPESHI